MATNNVAEYTAMIRGLEAAAELAKAGDKVVVRGDSQLVIKQMLGEYQVKAPNMRIMCTRAMAVVREVQKAGVKVSFEWVPREENAEADKLSKAVFVAMCKDQPDKILAAKLRWGKFEKSKLKDVPSWYYRWLWNRVPEMMPEQK